jgi:hypothetical protein
VRLRPIAATTYRQEGAQYRRDNEGQLAKSNHSFSLNSLSPARGESGRLTGLAVCSGWDLHSFWDGLCAPLSFVDKGPVKACWFLIFLNDGGDMFKNGKVQALLFLAAGSLLGYGAANGIGPWNWFTGAAQSGPQASSKRQADSPPAKDSADCCTECNPKGVLLVSCWPRTGMGITWATLSSCSIMCIC